MKPLSTSGARGGGSPCKMAGKMSAGHDEAALRKIYSKLVEGLKAIDILDKLYESDLLTTEEYDGIHDAFSQASSKDDSKAVNRRVLKAIRLRPPGYAAKLVGILKEKHSSLAEDLEKALAEVRSLPQTDPAPPLAVGVQPSSSKATSGDDKPSLNALYPAIPRIAVSWYALGLKLGAKYFTLDLTEQSHKDDPKKCCSEMLQNWLNGLQDCGDCPRTWDCLLQVVQTEVGSEASGFIKKEILKWEEEEEEETVEQKPALSGTLPAPPKSHPNAATSMSAHWPPTQAGTSSRQTGRSTTHRLSPTLKSICWPEFPALHNEFSTIVGKLSEALRSLEPAQFENLLVYLRERLRPMVDGCFPTGEPADLPRGRIAPLELIEHLQNGHYWDYLNTSLLKDVINYVTEAGSPLQSLMAKYKANVCSKVARTLKECKRKNVKPEPPPGHTIMALEVKCGGTPLSFHLHQILELKDLLVDKFSMRSALFGGFGKGSIVLYFFIPEEAAYSLCPKLESNCAALQDLHVTTVVIFDHFIVDVGFQEMTLLHKDWPSQVSSLEEEVEQLKQELKQSEFFKEELSAELRECHKVKVESEVYQKEPSGPMKHVKEEGEQGEEPALKKVKLEQAETVKEELELEGSKQVPPQGGVLPLSLFGAPYQTVLQPPSLTQLVQMGAFGSQVSQSGVFPPPVLSGPRRPVHQTPLTQSVEMGPVGSQQSQYPAQGSGLPLSVYSGQRQPIFHPPSLLPSAQMGPFGSLQTETLQTGPILHGRANLQSVIMADLLFPTSAATAIVIGDHIYICGGFCDSVELARRVQVYNINNQRWSTLPVCPQFNSQGASINGQLVLIGGKEALSRTITNLVSTWTGQVWTQDVPRMPTKRVRPGVTTHGNFVVVAGGRAEDKKTLLSTIDVLNITTRQWSTPTNLTLPRPMYSMQFTVSNAHLYVASATIEYDAATNTGTTTKSVWQLPVIALENALTTEGDGTSHHWTELAQIPYYRSVLLQDTAHLVAVGGDDESDKTTSDVFVYIPNANEWLQVGHLRVPRAWCAVASLTRSSFIVCGGCSDARDPDNTLLSSVEVVHV